MRVTHIILFITIAILSTTTFNLEHDDVDPLVVTQDGSVRGRAVTSFTGCHYVSFEGIPYGRAPVGALRFKAPQPAEPWSGLLNALEPGPDCPQLDPYTGHVVGNEDCLTLNVYISQKLHMLTTTCEKRDENQREPCTCCVTDDQILPIENATGASSLQLQCATDSIPQPVLVWIHGGSYTNGSGRLYKPDVLLSQGLVVVTVNYRLGAHGFLYWPEAGVLGNMGLRDQALALSWVKRNIASFGGDPGSVTLAGQSSGAACVVFHMLSPHSAGLFHRALCMSGSAVCPWATPNNPRERAMRLLRAAGLPQGAEDNAAAMAAFLAGPGADPDMLVPLHCAGLGLQVEPMFPVFGACVDAETGPDAFLPEDPQQLLASGHFQRVPLLTGVTDGEAKAFLLYGDMYSKKSLEAFDENFERMFELILHSAAIAQIRSFYFGNQPITEKSLVNVSNLLSDVNMVEPVERTVRLVSALSPVPSFLYMFSHQPHHSFWGSPLGLMDHLGVPGVPHGEELAALFPLLVGEPPPDDRVPTDDWVRHYFAKAVANFARTGSPVPKADKMMQDEWPAFTLQNPAYMNISFKPQIQLNLMGDRIEFWRKLFANADKLRNLKQTRTKTTPSAASSKECCLLTIFICFLTVVGCNH